MTTEGRLIEDVAGVILAGGASTRFGRNKATALFNGRPLIEKPASTLAGIFRQCLLVTNNTGTYEFLGWPSVRDLFPGCGPLAGIHAALSSIAPARAFISGCDMPMLDENLIRYLCRLPGAWDVILPWPANGPEPLYAVYNKSAVPVIEDNLRRGETKITRALAGLRTRMVNEDEIRSAAADMKTFTNINRPCDLAGM